MVYNTSEAGSKGIIYEDLIAVLTGALQQSLTEIQRLKDQVASQERTISAITNTLGAMVNTTISFEEKLGKLQSVVTS